MKRNNIVVVGTGYVGLSLALLLSKKNSVIALDILPDRVENINKRISPINDEKIIEFLRDKDLDLKASLDSQSAYSQSAYSQADFIIVAVPTNYDNQKNFFDTKIVEEVVKEALDINPNVVLVIKSTSPVGFTKELYESYRGKKILFSPEFLREGQALYDNLYPSRIVVGTDTSREDMIEVAKNFADILGDAAFKSNTEKLIMGHTEAEAVKLFSNTYLALRVSYFNELDTYAEVKGLDTRAIIDGVCMDPRIGDFYNNPSFGYGGYCLPKDTKQLLANYEDIPENLIEAIVHSNMTRKKHIANQVVELVKDKQKPVIGIYRLTMKADSDNFRESSIFGVIDYLKERGIETIVYEPGLEGNSSGILVGRVEKDLEKFKKGSDLIIANRLDESLRDVIYKIYTRDLFGVS